MAVGYVLSDTEIGAYASGDARPQLLAQLGFVTPPEFDELAGDLFYSSFSFEEMGRLDRDVLVWISGDADINAKIQANPLRQQLTAVAEGREIFLDQMQGGAFSFGSVLSIPYLLEHARPPARRGRRRRSRHRRAGALTRTAPRPRRRRRRAR